MMMGVVIIGLNLGRSIQVAQVCRDAGSMLRPRNRLFPGGEQERVGPMLTVWV